MPWAVSFGWVPLVIGVFALSTWIFNGRVLRFMAGASILVFADLIFDLAVLMTFWTRMTLGIIIIPMTNYLGWAFSSLIGGLIFIIFYPIMASKFIGFEYCGLGFSNAFWVGVAPSGGFCIPFVLAILLQMFMCMLVKN